MYPVWLVGAAYFCLGLIFGSFLNVCIYRLPRGLSVVRPRSACPECHQMISAQDNIPVISWLLLGGRCRHCKAPITPRYAVVEFTCAMLFLLCFLRSALPVDAVKGCVLCFLLLGLAFTDAETHLLPDAMTLTGLVAGILLSVISLVPGPAAALWPISFHGAPTPMQLEVHLFLRSMLNSLSGAAVGAGLLWAIAELYRVVRKTDGMGFGDVKLMAMVGSFLGPVLTLFVLATSAIAGGFFGGAVLVSIYRNRIRRYRPRLGAAAGARSWQAAQTAMRALEIPFGVFLCTMSLVAWFYGEALVRGYLRLLGY